MDGPSPKLLLVEDNDAHANLIRLAAELSGLPCVVDRVSDGNQALAFLRRDGDFCTKPRPDLVLLDLQLPHRSGHEVLRDMQEDASLREIPVIVLTTSDAEADRGTALANGANAYVVKPLQFAAMCEMIRDLVLFWTRWNRGAGRPASG